MERSHLINTHLRRYNNYWLPQTVDNPADIVQIISCTKASQSISNKTLGPIIGVQLQRKIQGANNYIT